MPADPAAGSDLPSAIAARLRAAGDPATAAGAKRYLKSDLEHLGVLLPAIRQAVRAELRPRQPFGHDELVAAARQLWRPRVHEYRIAAAILLEVRADLLVLPDTSLLEELLRASRTWALTDIIAGSAAGRLLMREPAAAADYRRWAAQDDMWLRRSGILAFLYPVGQPAGYQAYFGTFTEISDPLLADPRFFVRKAIGWVLRQASKAHPGDVYSWILPRAHRASGVTVRETVRYLSPPQRAAVLDAYRPRSQRT